MTPNALPDIPEPLRAEAGRQWAELCALWPGRAPPPAVAQLGPRVFGLSEFVARTVSARPELLAGLVESGDLLRAYGESEWRGRAQAALAGCADEAALKSALRRLRAREMVRIAWRELTGAADLSETIASLSHLADACIDGALAQLLAWAGARDGVPRAEGTKAAVGFVVLGMGKLGGQELNFSSDIDLIFAYAEEGETDQRGLSNHEFFVRLGQRLIQALNETTAEGFVFRVDMRLRPNGQSGPLALSFDGMEQYYTAHGRMWERYAFTKARCVAGDAAAGAELLARLKPFVYRRYLDYSAIEEIRAMKAMIHRELMRKGIASNIKLGPGGIREVEFIGQAFQLIRGGRDPRLQQRRILPVLALLAERGDLALEAVEQLAQAYVFLRNTENRLQMIGDTQTQVLPTSESDRLRLASAMGFDDWGAFHAELAAHMQRVHRQFESVFGAAAEEAPAEDAGGLQALWAGTLDETAAQAALRHAGYADPAEALRLLQALRAGGAYSAFTANGRERLDRLMPALLAATGRAPEANTTLGRLLALIEAIGRRSVYLALLVENPPVLAQLVTLCSASDWIARYLAQHPILLDELMNPASLYAPPDPAELAAECHARLARLPAEDLEAQMDALREFRHGRVLRVAATDVGEGLAPEVIGQRLGDIAEVVVAQAYHLAWDDLVRKHGRPTLVRDGVATHPGFAVVAYGKLGSLEMGYTSDLDMIFLHGAEEEGGETDGPRPIANEVFFARLAQRLIHVLTARTSGGILYEVDTRLRPSGRSGLLVTHPRSFREYQIGQAWVWEHQALIRARFIAGDAALGTAFAAIRSEVLTRPPKPEELRAAVVEMRERMHAAQPAHAPEAFNLKHDPGGMIDVEFMVQYWTLRHAAGAPELVGLRANIPLLTALARNGLIPEDDAAALVAAYRRYLGAEQRLKLMERKPLVVPDELGAHPAAVRALWQRVLGPR